MSDRYSFLCRHGNDMSMRRRCVEAGLEADTHASASAHSETTHLANLFFFLVLPRHCHQRWTEERVSSEMGLGIHHLDRR